MKITKHATDDTSYFNSGKTCNLKFISLKISISNTKRQCCESAAFNMPAKQWPQDWKRSVFIPIPKKGNVKGCSDYHTTTLISHASKVMLKIPQARLQ